MKSRSVAALVAGLAVAGYFGYRALQPYPKTTLRLHQEGILRLYHQLPQPDRSRADAFLNESSPGWEAAVSRFAATDQSELSTDLMYRMQVAVQPALKPVPILDGKLQPLFAQPDMSEAPSLTSDQIARILVRAQSVGRIEVKEGETYSLMGTAFVVGKSLIATNCHVVRLFTAQDRPSDPFVLRPQGRLLVDFGDGPLHDPANEFAIQSLKPCPGEGLDVAFLATADTSLDNQHPLPTPLTLSNSLPALTPANKEFNVGAIGYPDLAGIPADPAKRTPTQRLFQGFSSQNKYAKFYSPGAITAIKTVSRLDFLFHIVSTMPGESGSPLLDTDVLNVVGVHICCEKIGGDLPTPSDLACMTRLLTSPANIAVGSSSVLKDHILGPLLVR